MAYRKTLPTYYYLDHFYEFLAFLETHNTHLLRPEDHNFIATFKDQTHAVQCILVRSLNRKYPVIKKASFSYPEIEQPQQAVAEAITTGWLASVPEEQVDVWLAQLTKPELLQVLHATCASPVSKQAKKDELLALASQLSHSDVAALPEFEAYVYRAVDEVIEYGLFLFFGHLSGRLNQFSLRDLGLMRTRKQITEGARYSDAQQASTGFYWLKARQQLKRTIRHQHPLPALLESSEAVGTQAVLARDEYFYLYGKACIKAAPETALHCWQQSQYHDAYAKRLRYTYLNGDKEAVKAELEQLIADPPDEEVLLFAEDFLARKFEQKRTSTLTDWLREASDVIVLDEIHKNRVERACVDHYQAQGKLAFRMENEPWRALFGLVFWPILFAKDMPAGNEFDYRPYHIIHNNLYTEQGDKVEAELALLEIPSDALKTLLHRATACYGQPNGIFRWHQVIYQRIERFFQYLAPQHIQGMLRAMAQNYAMYCDGFPDIAVVEDKEGEKSWVFKEVKASGDVLRKNQLVTLSKMRELDMQVEITRVEWGIDPAQVYVVVDIETTGGRAGNHKITEIGAVKVQHGKIIDEWQTLLNPERRIPANITALTGISDAMVSNAPRFSEVADEFRAFCEGAIFVAHNVNFDFGFIKTEYERIDQRFSMPKLCTVQQMRKVYPKLPSYSLANLTKHFAIKMTRHHRAMSDAKAAAELLAIINAKRLMKSD
jgi:DNA polymerase-3 subunit epsilon